MTSNLILSDSHSPISRRVAKQSATKRKQAKSAPRKSSSLPAETVDYLKAWMMSPEHIAHPYPTDQEKCVIMADTGIELKQLTNWFVNNRKRYWKPRVEARLQQQAKEAAASKTSVQPTTAKLNTQSPSTRSRTYVDMTKSSSVPVSPANVNMVDPSAFVSLDRARSPRAVSIGSSSFASESDDASLVSDEMNDEFNNDVLEEGDANDKNKVRIRRDSDTAGSGEVYSNASKKRAREEDEVMANRPKYLRQCPPVWRDACRSADTIYDRELPSLDEASHLFGYSVV